MGKRLETVLSAPHRAMFLVGALVLLGVSAWWTAELAARATGTILAVYPAPAGWLHGALMTFAVLPFFIFGFAMTAMPRWQGQRPVPRPVFRGVCALMTTGCVLVVLGLWLPASARTGILLAAAGWAIGAVRLTQIAGKANPQGPHLRLIAAALWAGFAGGVVAGAAVYRETAAPLRAALEVGIWWFLIPTFATVAHRAIPLWGNALPREAARSPTWTLPVLIAGSFAHGACSLAGAQSWLWLADLPAAAAALRLSWAWCSPSVWQVRLLAMHHVAFAWLGISLALIGVQDLANVAGVRVLGLAPLHALTIGFFASMLFGVATRVTLGHSGRPVIADSPTWRTFWLVQAAALLRIAGELTVGSVASALALIASAVWLAAFGVWAARLLPFYWGGSTAQGGRGPDTP